MFDHVYALPGAEAQFGSDDGDVKRHAVQHRLDMRRHIVRPFHIMDPLRVFRRQPIECRDQIGLHVGISVFLDRK